MGGPGGDKPHPARRNASVPALTLTREGGEVVHYPSCRRQVGHLDADCPLAIRVLMTSVRWRTVQPELDVLHPSAPYG